MPGGDASVARWWEVTYPTNGRRLRPSRLLCYKLERCGRGQVNAVSVAEDEPINTLAAIDHAVEAFRVLNHPCAVLLVYLSVQARNTLRWYLYVVPGKSPNCERWLVQRTLAD